MEITLKFSDEKLLENFWSWWLDGGGEQEFSWSTEYHLKKDCQSKEWNRTEKWISIVYGDEV